MLYTIEWKSATDSPIIKTHVKGHKAAEKEFRSLYTKYSVKKIQYKFYRKPKYSYGIAWKCEGNSFVAMVDHDAIPFVLEEMLDWF